MDIYENDEQDHRAEGRTPGRNREDISLKVENSTLTLSGQKQADKEVRSSSTTASSGRYGSFTRSFTLPATVDTGRIAADYKNGVLTVTLPLREDAKPKQIDVAVH